jgi:hypothetical protein
MNSRTVAGGRWTVAGGRDCRSGARAPRVTALWEPATGNRQPKPAVLLLVLTLLLSSCAFDVYRVEVCDMLYFGTAKADGSAVSDAEWQRFLADEITKRFPDGLTTWEANGQWRTKSGEVEHERTHIVQIIHADGGRAEGSIHAIIDAYKKGFAQESVLRVRTHAGVAFQ